MNPFKSASEEGYSEDEIIKFISNAFPKFKNKISQAAGLGYSANQIINFLSSIVSKGQNIPANITQAEVETIQRKQDKEKINQFLKNAALVGGSALAGSAVKSAIPGVANLLSKRGTPNIPTGQSTNQMPAMAQTQGAPQTQSAPIPEESIQELPNQSDKALKAKKLVEQMGLDKKIASLGTKNPPEVIMQVIKSFMTPTQKAWLKKQTDEPIENVVRDFLLSNPSVNPVAAKEYERLAKEKEMSSASLSPDALQKQFEQNYPQAKVEEKEVTPKEIKNRNALLPNGDIGKVIDEKQGIAKIEMPNGTVKTRKVSDIDVESPDLEKQVTDLIESIPETDRSAVLAFGSYNPGQEFTFEGKKLNIPMLGIQFHSGDFYLYPGVTQEQFDRVVSKSVGAKTTGSNPWHAWTAGKGSRGAGFIELKKELEKEFGQNFIKLSAKGGYDYFKLIREIVKKIERERKKGPKSLPE